MLEASPPRRPRRFASHASVVTLKGAVEGPAVMPERARRSGGTAGQVARRWPRGHRLPTAEGQGRAATIAMVTVTVVGAFAVLSFIGADARWLAALGGAITAHGDVPSGIPFATAPTGHWPNAIVLSEIAFHGLQSAAGDRGLLAAQLLAVGVAVAVLARDAIAGGTSQRGAVTATLLAAAGATASLAVVRAQLFSLPLFALLVALLRADARAPSRRLWLVVPLLALWANLHGAVLVGLGVTGLYLALTQLRDKPVRTVALGVACLVAVCVTPAGVRTPLYYLGVLTNEAARHGDGLWARLSPTSPLDVLLILCAGTLAARLRRGRVAAWEVAVLLALAAMTVSAGRSGVWLLLFVLGPAARSMRGSRAWDRLLPPLAAAATLGLLAGVARGPIPTGASGPVVARAVALAHGTPVLAEALRGEQIVLAGGRVWLSNPIDAFSHRDQNRYLDWAAGRPGGLGALDQGVDVVVTARDSAADQLMARQQGFTVASSDATTDIFVRLSRARTTRPTSSSP